MQKTILIAAAMLLAACSRNIQNPEAVRQSVIDYLKARTAQTGLNVDLLQVDVTSVSFDRDQARASVAIRPKSGGGGAMTMGYILDRKGNKWVVRPREDAGASPHGAGAGAGAAAEDGKALPPGHPSINPPAGQGAPSGTLPPGHPAIGSKQ